MEAFFYFEEPGAAKFRVVCREAIEDVRKTRMMLGAWEDRSASRVNTYSNLSGGLP
jgi:hypothetical protein